MLSVTEAVLASVLFRRRVNGALSQVGMHSNIRQTPTELWETAPSLSSLKLLCEENGSAHTRTPRCVLHSFSGPKRVWMKQKANKRM